jgi:hypothetical protein
MTALVSGPGFQEEHNPGKIIICSLLEPLNPENEMSGFQGSRNTSSLEAFMLLRLTTYYSLFSTAMGRWSRFLRFLPLRKTIR